MLEDQAVEVPDELTKGGDGEGVDGDDDEDVGESFMRNAKSFLDKF